MRDCLAQLRFCVLCLSLAACDEPAQTDSKDPVRARAANAPAMTGKITDRVMQKWTRSCALCHASGVGGAPRAGVAGDWLPRLARGKQTLMTHTIEGFNNMPPLGYCMSCEQDDFEALIDFMAGESP